MIDAKLTNRIGGIGGRYGDRESIYTLFCFVVPSVDASDKSDVVRFKMGDRLGFEFYKSFSESTKYTVELFTKKNAYGINKFLEAVDINKWAGFDDYEQGGSLSIINMDQPQEPYIYGVITNNDAVNATGLISFEFLTSSI